MSDAGKAVFLSYASQDAEAARRICDALRASGVEVWFDADGGLEHGDEWDVKIRKQIKECVLFIPIISANTQARHEGYFRLEWDLAAERARTIASGVPFILPVVIDDTREPAALVPDRFRTVQWMRLAGGVVTAQAQQRLLKLWSHRTGALQHEAAREGMSDALLATGARSSETRNPTPGNRVWIAAAVVALLAGAGWWAVQSRDKPGASKPPATAPASPEAEARQLTAPIWELFANPDRTRALLNAADDMGRRATKLAPNEADAWAAWAVVDAWMLFYNFENSMQARDAARTKITKALQLAPRSFEARLAQATSMLFAGGDTSVSAFAPQAEALAGELLKERPAEPRALYVLQHAKAAMRKIDEHRAVWRELVRNPRFAAEAWNGLGWSFLSYQPDYAAAEDAADQAVALKPCFASLALKTNLALWWRGDPDAAQRAWQKLSLTSLQDDWAFSEGCFLHYARRDAEAMLRLAGSFPREWLQSHFFDGPVAYFSGLAHHLAGRKDSARLQWETGLKLVEARLASAPASANLLHLKGTLQSLLGERGEAAKTIRLARQNDLRNEIRSGSIPELLSPAFDPAVAGDWDGAFPALEEGMKKGAVTWAMLRLHPVLDPVREDPRFKALLARAATDPRLSPAAAQRSGVIPPADAFSPGKSVAVLAFENLSGDKDNEYFSDGISEELLNVLAKVPGLRVAARTSAFYFKGKNATAQEIGQKLGVAHLVDGSVSKAGTKVRIRARLSKAETGEQLWSERYEEELKDIFALQDKIAREIAGKLQASLGGSSPLARTINPEAFQLYLLGRHHFNKGSEAGWTKAREVFLQALKLEPNYALAYCGLADAYGWLGGFVLPGIDAWAKEREYAEKALALEPNLGDAHLSLSLALGAVCDWAGYEREIKRALELNPNLALAFDQYALLLTMLGRFDEAVAMEKRAIALDPLSSLISADFGSALYQARRYGDAIEQLRKVEELDPNYSQAHFFRAWAEFWNGDSGAAIARFERALSLDEQPWFFGGLGYASAASGNRASAEQILRKLDEMAKKRYVSPWPRADIYLALGEKEKAYEWLEKCYEQQDPACWYFRIYRPYDPIRSEPRFQALLKKTGLHDEQLK